MTAKKIKSSKQKWALIALALVVFIGATLAYFNQTLTAQNKLGTKNFGSELIEEFTPNKEWQPGATVNKKVAVENTGDYNLIARVSWKEWWIRNNDTTNTKFEEIALNDVEAGANPTSAVIKDLTADSNWVYGNDGYFYYLLEVEPGQISANWIDSITLKEDASMGTLIETMYYTSAESKPGKTEVGTDPATQWVKFTGAVPDGAKYVRSVSEVDPDNAGYSNANYTLEIKIEVMQATSEAINGTWLAADVATKPSGSALTFLQGI